MSYDPTHSHNAFPSSFRSHRSLCGGVDACGCYPSVAELCLLPFSTSFFVSVVAQQRLLLHPLFLCPIRIVYPSVNKEDRLGSPLIEIAEVPSVVFQGKQNGQVSKVRLHIVGEIRCAS